MTAERDPDFFKLHYRQWKRRMHKARVPYDLQGALLDIVIETHLTGAPPAYDDNVLAGVLMVSPRKARAAVDKLVALGLVCIEDGSVVDKTAVEDAAERSQLRAIRAEAGREGGVRSGVVRRDKARLNRPSGEFASDKPLKNNKSNEAKSETTFELEKRREEKEKREAKASPKNPDLLGMFPDWVGRDAARGFIEYRAKRKPALTDRAVALQVGKLAQIRDRGGSPDEALDLAALRGWQAIEPDWYFREKGKANGRTDDQSPQQRRASEALDARLANVAGRWTGGGGEAVARADPEDAGERGEDRGSGGNPPVLLLAAQR